MISSRFSYLKMTAVVAFLALALTQSINPSTATTVLPAPGALPDVDLASELQTLDSFGDDLGKFERKRADLGKKSSLTSSEFKSLNDDQGALKRRLSQVPNAIRGIISKLKAAGKWETFDEDLLASSTDEKFKASVREFGGAKKLFEEGASLLASSAAASDILGSLDDVQKKVAGGPDQSREFESRFVAVSYSPVPIFARSAACVLATVGYGAKMITHPFKHVSAPLYSCKCHGSCGDATT